MLIIGTVGATIITMAYLENKGKISINKSILYVILITFGFISGWWVLDKIKETFLLNI